jgi:hypothetical protein
VKHLCLVVFAGSILSSWVSDVEAQHAGSVQCFVLDVEDPSILYMLGQDVQGEVLVLTDEPLRDSPGVTEGRRAYLGTAQWQERGPLRPFSWYWRRTESDSIRVAFVLPLWGIVWIADEMSEGLVGEVTYYSDEVGEPRRTSRFSGTRVPCESVQ